MNARKDEIGVSRVLFSKETHPSVIVAGCASRDLNSPPSLNIPRSPQICYKALHAIICVHLSYRWACQPMFVFRQTSTHRLVLQTSLLIKTWRRRGRVLTVKKHTRRKFLHADKNVLGMLFKWIITKSYIRQMFVKK